MLDKKIKQVKCLIDLNNIIFDTGLPIRSQLIKSIDFVTEYCKEVLTNGVVREDIDYMAEYYTAILHLKKSIETSSEIIDTLQSLILAAEKFTLSQSTIEFSERNFLKYLNEWRLFNIFIEMHDNEVKYHVDNEMVMKLIKANKHRQYNNLYDYLSMMQKCGCTFYIQRSHDTPIHVTEFFILDIRDLDEFSDDIIGLYSKYHKVGKKTYQDWLSQITNPRCRAIKANGRPCGNLFSIKHAKKPSEFNISEHTCCHLHRDERFN